MARMNAGSGKLEAMSLAAPTVGLERYRAGVLVIPGDTQVYSAMGWVGTTTYSSRKEAIEAARKEARMIKNWIHTSYYGTLWA